MRRPRLPSLASLRSVRLSGLSMQRGSAGRDFFDNVMRWGGRDRDERGRDRDRGRGRGRDRGRRDVVARRDSAFRWPDVDLRRRGGGGGGGGGSLLQSCLSACCCCGCCCCCLNLQYLRTLPGVLRLVQLALSWMCNWLVGRYALRVSGTLGSAMPAFFLASAGGALGCSLLLAVALLSAKSVALLRASLFVSTHDA
ncbi:Protein singles bar [Frankliniella fusca]|uniref:Protein singles bar n=1 Tax=Frankliniella fusca TaxID=407009 RepID=A0AAE1HF64_9NEOP|nr:Protein singles bar [Frankliniella fusca]